MMNSTESPDDLWRATRTSLAYRVTVFTLGYWHFDALAFARHFTGAETDRALAMLPAPDGRRYIFPSHPVSAPPPEVQRVGGYLIYTPKTFPNYYVDLRLDGGFDGYLASFSSKTRSTLKRKVRRFAEASPGGKLDWRVYRTPAEIETFLPLAARVSALTYQERLLDCGLPDDEAFRREAAHLAERRCAYGFLLFHDEQPIAYVFCRRRDGVVYYSYVGHDPAHNEASPGTVLQYQILAYLFDDPDAEIFDFTEGEGPHKALFATDRKLCAKSFALPSGPATSLRVGTHRLLGQLDRGIDAVVDRFQLRQRLRRFVRRGAST